MRKALFLPIVGAGLIGLSACNSAKNEAAEANETVAGDSNTMGEAVSDVDAAQNDAFGVADNAASDNAAMAAGEVEEGELDGNEITD